jgi:glycosyltransferase involved in cell wall biosynthesis
MSPLLSIIIPAYNVEKFIIPAIHSALNQTFEDIEVIVVDDGSTDSTAQQIQSIQDDRLKCIRQANGGLSAARNSGIRAARGNYIGLLDGDDIWFPEKAKIHLNVMEADASIGLTYSHSAYMNEAGEFTGQLLVSTIDEPTIVNMITRNLVGNGSSLILRKECVHQAGLFDESLRSVEDIEMWVRILGKTNFKFRLIPEVLTGYRVRTQSLTSNFDKFMIECHKYVQKIKIYFPENWDVIKAKILAENYRIVARKALSAGEYDIAKHFLIMACREYPLLFFKDLRAVGTLVIILLQSIMPNRFRDIPYKLIRLGMEKYYNLIYSKKIPEKRYFYEY